MAHRAVRGVYLGPRDEVPASAVPRPLRRRQVLQEATRQRVLLPGSGRRHHGRRVPPGEPRQELAAGAAHRAAHGRPRCAAARLLARHVAGCSPFGLACAQAPHQCAACGLVGVSGKRKAPLPRCAGGRCFVCFVQGACPPIIEPLSVCLSVRPSVAGPGKRKKAGKQKHSHARRHSLEKFSRTGGGERKSEDATATLSLIATPIAPQICLQLHRRLLNCPPSVEHGEEYEPDDAAAGGRAGGADGSTNAMLRPKRRAASKLLRITGQNEVLRVRNAVRQIMYDQKGAEGACVPLACPRALPGPAVPVGAGPPRVRFA